MKEKDFNRLSEEQQKKEIEKCKSFEYFYRNYCWKEGMPEYSEEVFNQYKKDVEQKRLRPRRIGPRFANWLNQHPLTPEESVFK